MPASLALEIDAFDEVSTLFPLHVRVRKMMERFIIERVWLPGRKIPSSRLLSEQLGLSRTTVQTAVDELLADGYLRSVPRSGVFVESLDHTHPGANPGLQAPDWKTRIRPLPTIDLPHLERTADWHRYPFPFITGQHDPQYFPDQTWLSALRRSLSPEHRHSSLDDTLADDPLLIDALCSTLLPSRGLYVQPENVLITLGSQEALSLIADSLVRPGTVVSIEDPGYIDARHVFTSRGAEVEPVVVDNDGLRVSEIPPSTELCFVTPSHQHPTSVALTAARRLDLIRKAADEDFIIIEDDYDSELRYRGRPTPAIASLDPSRVLYLGSMSKIFAPGLRIGFVVADSELISMMRWRRRYMHRQAPGQIQRALGLLLQEGSFNRSLQAYRRELSHRWTIATQFLQRELGTPPFPPGGTALWVPLPFPTTSTAVVRSAARRGVLIDPGELYFCNSARGRHHIRVGFSVIATDRIEPGLTELVEIVRANGK